MLIDHMMPRSQVALELGTTPRSIMRWEKEKRPGFDRPVKIGSRVYHPRSRVEAVKLLGNALQPEAAE